MWDMYVYDMLQHGVFGGRLWYSRYAVRPYIGGMYHQGDVMLDVCMLQYVMGLLRPLSYDVMIGCDRISWVGILVDLECCQ